MTSIIFLPFYVGVHTTAALRESRTAIQRIPNKPAQVKHFLNEFSQNLFSLIIFLDLLAQIIDKAAFF
jgi:hypothetical protein